MQVHHGPPNSWLSYAIPFAIIAVVMILRIRRMSRMRPLRIEQLWIVPALYLAVVTMLFVQHPPSVQGWASAAIALVAGGVLGWQRGKLMRIHVDPETHALNQQASIAGMAFLVVLVFGRFVAETASGSMHMNVGMIVDTLAALALGMFSVQRLEMYLRAKRMLAEARAGSA
ncbi:CcdC protein domain-containing protein [Hephaestia mangrovi]|uniref:CcdC protein domain-containing protein n=1 Tax=Hephaestia mangrovi TaxID=2873268 RepID=UPI001CA61B21|nr:CcdC protein domain-containing protein [Hephaestia mangrovi]MBY8826700.1 cytochrome c biogenesis protein CcdC [Hephaestia mangrovi]